MLKLSGIRTDEFSPKNEGTEKLKKLQRLIQETVRRIDLGHRDARSIEEVFSDQLLDLRVKLREFTNKIVHLDPGKESLRYLETYWRKACHKPVSLVREIGGMSINKGNLLLDCHIMSGMGYFQNFIFNITQEFGWKGPDLEFLLSSRLDGLGFGYRPDRERDASEWLPDLVGQCLVWLGDLARYSIDLYPNEKEMDEKDRRRVLATKYYTLATTILPNNGLPYNQLASIVPAGPYQNIQQVFFYLKCMISPGKFEGGETNLRRLLEKNETELNNMADKDGNSHVMANVAFLHLVASLLGEKAEDEVTSNCHHSLVSIHQVLTGSPGGDWLAKLVSCVIFLNHILSTSKASTFKASLCQAWLVALTAHLSGLLVGKVGRSVWGQEWTENNINLENKSDDSEDEEEKTSGKSSAADQKSKEDHVEIKSKEPEPEPKKKKKKKRFQSLLRRRRAPRSASASDNSSQSEGDSDSDSESEDGSSIELSDSSYSDVDDDLSQYSTDGSGQDSSQFNSDLSEDERPVNGEHQEEKEVNSVDLEDILTAANDTGLLPSVWLCFMWLKSQPEVLSGIDNTEGNQLWMNMGRLFTLLQLTDRSGVNQSVKVDKLRHAASQKPYKLTEEVYLAGLDKFKNYWKSGDVDVLGGDASRADGGSKGGGVFVETILRLERIAGWRDWILSRDDARITWCQEENRAVLRKPKCEKKAVMKHMAELWLREEVSQLERENTISTEYEGGRCILVVDAPALISDLHTVRRAVGHKRFTKAVVPQVVIRELDNVKKSIRTAREAIRWLERELSRGHKGLRVQEKEETVGDNNHLTSKNDQAAWNRFKVIECAAYFCESQKKEVDVIEDDQPASALQVILLTGDKEILNNLDTASFQALKDYGVKVENVDGFMQRFLGLRDAKNQPRNRHRSGNRRRDGSANGWADRKDKDNKYGGGPRRRRRNRSGEHHRNRRKDGDREEKLRRRMEARSELG